MLSRSCACFIFCLIMPMLALCSDNAHAALLVCQFGRMMLSFAYKSHDVLVYMMPMTLWCVIKWCPSWFPLSWHGHDALIVYQTMPLILLCSSHHVGHDAILCCHMMPTILVCFPLMLVMLSFIIKWCPRTLVALSSYAPICLSFADNSHVA